MARRAVFWIVLVLALAVGQGAQAEDGRQAKEPGPEATLCPGAEPDRDELLAGRGCCSHHRGQCGCEGGRVVCCDGSLSPSCRCEKDEGKGG